MRVLASTVILESESRGTHDQSREAENLFHGSRSRTTAFRFL
jgi:hypothetical protein